MINIAAKVPAERRAAIDKIRQQPEFGPGSKAAAWGLEIEPSMMPVNGRALPPPRIQYHPSSGRGATPSVQFGFVFFLRSLAARLSVDTSSSLSFSAHSAWNLRDSKFLQSGKPLER